VLTGKYGRAARPSASDGRLGADEGMGAVYLTERNLDIADEVRQVAREVQATPAQVALAWLRDRPGVVVPIVGSRSEAQIRDNIAAVDLELGAEHRQRLDTVSAVDLGFPYDFMTRPGTGELPFGESYGRLHDHRRDRSGRPLESLTAGQQEADR
jgi:hypothetical protein